MNSEKDLELKKLILEQIEKTRPIPFNILKDIKNPYYSSGREIKIGDRIINLLIKKNTIEKMSTVSIELFHESQVNEICKEYLLDIAHNFDTIYVIKKNNEQTK